MTWTLVLAFARAHDLNGERVVKIRTTDKDAPASVELTYSHAVVELADVSEVHTAAGDVLPL
jgi:hypothetical protein